MDSYPEQNYTGNMNEQYVDTNRVIKVSLLFLFVIGATFAIRLALTGGVPVVKLQPGSPIASAVSLGLGVSASSGSLPVEGKDFSLQNVQYLDAKKWVVASISMNSTTSGTSSDKATVVLQEQASGIYRLVLGPGTAFSATDTADIPNDVTTYMQHHGVLIYSEGGGS